MKKLTLKLNDCTPETLPMKRLCQYLAHLSDMLGEVERVHFSSVGEGSAMLNLNVEALHYPHGVAGDIRGYVATITR